MMERQGSRNGSKRRQRMKATGMKTRKGLTERHAEGEKSGVKRQERGL